jgi:hypothetical protein
VAKVKSYKQIKHSFTELFANGTFSRVTGLFNRMIDTRMWLIKNALPKEAGHHKKHQKCLFL